MADGCTKKKKKIITGSDRQRCLSEAVKICGNWGDGRIEIDGNKYMKKNKPKRNQKSNKTRTLEKSIYLCGSFNE